MKRYQYLAESKATEWSTILSMLLMVCLLSMTINAQKPILAQEDYGRWEYLQGSDLSPDGSWLYYSIRKVNGDRELCIHSVNRDSTEKIPWGESAIFSSNSQWMAWQVGFSPSEEKKLKKSKKPLHKKVQLLNLSTGEKFDFESISAMAFDATSQFLVLHGYSPKEPKGKGSDLRLLTLDDQREMTFGNVSGFKWSNSEALLAMTIATGRDAGNGIQVFNASTSQLLSLDASSSKYTHLSWHEDDLHLAGLKSTLSASKDTTSHELLAWKNLNEGRSADFTLSLTVDTLELVASRKPVWSDDGQQISFGIRKHITNEVIQMLSGEADSIKTKFEEEDVAKLQLWHSSDLRIYPRQKANERRDENRSLLSVWNLETDKVTQVGSHLQGDADIMDGWRYGVESLSDNYAWGQMFGRPYHDVWVTNLSDGSRKLAVEKVRRSWTSSGGKFVLWYNGKDYLCYDVATGLNTNITASLDANFINKEYDTPTDQLPPYGIGGWIEHDEGVLLYDQYDIWLVSPDGSGGKKLTNGAGEEITHRMVYVYHEDDFVNTDRPQFVSLHGEWSEKRGYAKIDFEGRVDRLILEDKRIRSLTRADSSDVFMYRGEARDDSPDLFVTDLAFSSSRQVTETNPWLEEYAWTKSELIDFESEAGIRLQTGLLYPVNYEEGKRYPMIVYTYEVLSPGIHSFEPPSMRDYYNFTAWTHNGYFVLLPDIKYRPRDPGVSAIEAVRPAIRKVVDKGYVDASKVGLIGHSWGGYQATYLPTRTDLFAASVAGAPLTDFVSFMGQIHWNPGIPEVDHWETGQARMEVPFWEDPEAHFRNSPIHKIHEMETPLLMAFGNDDGVVDWDQGTEFYNFARRAGKQMVLLVYEGEDHGFRQKANQMDYHQRILEWFGHYLKDEPAPDWITKGISLKDHKEEIERLARTEK